MLARVPEHAVHVTDVRRFETDGIVAADFEIVWLDSRGALRTGPARIWIPERALEPEASLPLRYQAGYEAVDEQAVPVAAEGYVVVATGPAPAGADPLAWHPIPRGPNLDFALLHLARALPFVDLSRVLIAGGSAGAYMALLLAAESFPVAAVLADLPPVNLGYQINYMAHNREIATSAWRESVPGLPGLASVLPLEAPTRAQYGPDTSDRVWFEHSPISLTHLITAPVSIVASTADMLVPLPQISKEHAIPPPPASMPEGFSADPTVVGSAPSVRLSLAEVLAPQSARFDVVVVPATTSRLEVDPEHPEVLPRSSPIPIPWPDVQWAVTVLDEGPPEPAVVHVKYAVQFDRSSEALARLLDDPGIHQLTGPKLQQQLARLAGREWLSPGCHHLQTAATERADVCRGFAAYLGNEEARQRFMGLYGEVEPELKARSGLPSPAEAALAYFIGGGRS